MKDSACIFCKIAEGEIPSYTIYEDEDFRAFLDLSPAGKGHTLLIPKEHYANIWELDEEISKKLIPTAKKIAKKLQQALGCDGIQLVQNNGTAAGQTVFHFHLHLMPCYEESGAKAVWASNNMTSEELKELAKLITGE